MQEMTTAVTSHPLTETPERTAEPERPVPPPKPEVPPRLGKQRQRESVGSFGIIEIGIVIFMCIVSVALAIFLIPRTSSPTTTPPPQTTPQPHADPIDNEDEEEIAPPPASPSAPTHYPLVQFMAAGKCMVVMPEQLIKGSEHYLASLEKIRESMEHYMEHYQYDGICALDIGYPICFCMLRQKKSRQVIGLYNFNITTMSNSLLYNQESSHFCEENEFRYVARSTTVVVEYLVEDGGYMEREFYQQDSFAVQNMWELNQGVPVCEREERIEYIQQCYRMHITSARNPSANMRLGAQQRQQPPAVIDTTASYQQAPREHHELPMYRGDQGPQPQQQHNYH